MCQRFDVATTAPSSSNGVAGSDLRPGPSPGQVASIRGRASRAETLAALEGGSSEPTSPTPPTSEATTPSEALANTPAPVEDRVEPAGAAPAVDPEAARRVAEIQKAERRGKEAVQKERAELRAELQAERAKLADERKELEALRAEVDAFKKAKERAAVDPTGYLEAAGVTDLEYAARLAYAKAKGDPSQREAAAAAMRAREQGDEIGTLRKRLDDLTNQLAHRDATTTLESQWSTYLDGAVKSIGDDAPLARSAAAKNPAAFRAKVRAEVERYIRDNDGDVPDFDDALALFEKTRRAELEDLGIDVATVIAPKQQPKQTNKTADEKQTAKTLGNDLSTPRVPRPKQSERDSRAETLALIEAGKLE